MLILVNELCLAIFAGMYHNVIAFYFTHIYGRAVRLPLQLYEIGYGSARQGGAQDGSDNDTRLSLLVIYELT